MDVLSACAATELEQTANGAVMSGCAHTLRDPPPTAERVASDGASSNHLPHLLGSGSWLCAPDLIESNRQLFSREETI